MVDVFNGLAGEFVDVVNPDTGDTFKAFVQTVNSSGGGGSVESVAAGTGIAVDSTDPANPVVSITNPIASNTTGNAATATALATGRTFSLTGGATGTSGAFTGAANASIPVTLATPTSTVRGGVLQQAALDGATATVADVITALVAAGVLASA